MVNVSIHRLLRAWPFGIYCKHDNTNVSIHRLLRAWPTMLEVKLLIDTFRSTGSYEPDQYPPAGVPKAKGFDPQALTSLTSFLLNFNNWYFLFRSTGSYEPDLGRWLHKAVISWFRSTGSYEPDPHWNWHVEITIMFRSTGSYEPDRFRRWQYFRAVWCFDPQALTSLTQSGIIA